MNNQYRYRPMSQKGVETLRRHNQAVAGAECSDFEAELAEKQALMAADAAAYLAIADDEFPVYHKGRRIK